MPPQSMEPYMADDESEDRDDCSLDSKDQQLIERTSTVWYALLENRIFGQCTDFIANIIITGPFQRGVQSFVSPRSLMD